MEAAGLALGVLTAFKEVYLVAKFIYKTAESASSHHTQREELLLKFYRELLYLRLFCRCFVDTETRVIQETASTQECLQALRIIFDEIRRDFTDYAKLAAESDAQYKKYSPYMNPEFFDTRVIEFTLDINDLRRPASTAAAPTWFQRRAANFRAPLRHPLLHTGPWKWALFERQHFEGTIARFKRQNEELNHWIPIMLTCDPDFSRPGRITKIDLAEDAEENGIEPHILIRRLAHSGQVHSTELRLTHQIDSSNSSSAVLQAYNTNHRNLGNMPEGVWIEHKHYAEINNVIGPWYGSERLVHQLAALLATAGKYNMHTLPFMGYMHEEEHHRYAFFFKYPQGSMVTQPPVSLHQRISQENTGLPLHARFMIASAISKALGTFHADSWVHKSIRSTSVQFFHDTVDTVAYNQPYLVGFEYSRPEEEVTACAYDSDLESNLYRHPERQIAPIVRFNKTHDVYALGVVLLEIGMWQTAMALYQSVYKKRKPRAVIDAHGLQQVFFRTAKRYLPQRMGQSYTEAVLTCLSSDLRSTTLSDAEFTIGFQTKVVEKLDVKRLLDYS